MKKTLLYFLLLLSFGLNAQNSADIDLVVGSGYLDFHKVDVIAEQADGKVIVGGSFFEQLGGQHWVGNLVRFNTDGSIDSSFQAAPFLSSGWITALAIQSDGKVLVGGNFTMMGEEPASHLIRLNADGSRDTTFTHQIYGRVRSIALQADGKIVVAGNFSSYINEHIQRYVLRLNPDGSKDHTFDFGFEGFAALYTTVDKVTVQADGKILAGGNFMTFNGQSQGMLIRFNADGTKDTSFDIGVGGAPNSKVENIIEQADGKILVTSGRNWNNTSYRDLIRLNSNGSMDTSFILSDHIQAVSTLALKPDGKIIIIGRFIVDGVNVGVLRINSDGTLDTTFTAIPSTSQVSCVALQTDGKILLGGYLKEYAGVMKNSFTRLNSNGTPDTTFNLGTGLNDKVTTIALQANGKTLLGGDFTRFQGVSKNRIISLNDDGSINASFNIGSGFNQTVRNIVTQLDGKILVCGDFTEFNGASANHIIRLNSDGTKDNSFNVGSGFNNYVQAIALQPDGKVLIGGRFTSFDGQTQKYCIRLNTDGSKDTGFEVDESFDDRVTQIALQADGKIFVAGNFSTFNGQGQRYMISLHMDGSKDPSFDVGTSFDTYYRFDSPYDIINDIAIQQDDKIVVLANTSRYQGLQLGNPLRINADGSIDETFVHSVRFSRGFLNTVAIQEDGKILVGGDFYTVKIGGINEYQNRIVRFNANGGKDESFDINEGHQAQSGGFYQGDCDVIVLDPNGKIWVGGSFFHYRLVSSFSAIRLVGNATTLSVYDVESKKNETLFYPNPVKEILYLNKTVKTLKISDITGKTLVIKKNINKVDMSFYPSGIYFVTIENENDIIENKKILKL